MYDNLSKVIDVDINEILPNRFQPRIQFDEEEILELSDSIKEHGVIQPLVVRPIGDKYEIIAGERRYKASVLAGKETVPVIVRNLNDKDSAEIALIENIQRKNLTPIEEALSYKKILDMGYITQENLASKLGKSQPSVANKIRLLNLTDEVQEALLENKISERHARSLLKLSSSEQQNQMLNRIITERLTVRRTDEEIDKLKNSDNELVDSKKIIEKGEIDMNNNMYGMPNIPQNPQPSFDIFGAPAPTPQPVSSNIEQPTPVPSFDIFSNTTPQPTVNPATQDFMSNMPSGQQGVSTAPSISEVPSVPPQPEMPSMGFTPMQDSFGTISQVTAPFSGSELTQPVSDVAPVSIPNPAQEPSNNFSMPAAPTPSAPQQPEMSQIGGIHFDANGNVVSVDSATPTSSSVTQTPQPVDVPTISPIPPVPETAPIMESSADNAQMTQQSENLFSFGEQQPEVQTQKPVQQAVPEFKMPEPIIVTDYSKQYDPVMPQNEVSQVPKIDFKEVIAAIRECSNKIEQYGFKIDLEEYDLANLYQVVFKIEK